jgi:trimeric autotransporter adhesin
VWVNGSPQVVPIGTTVGNLLDAAGQRVSAGAGVPAGMRLLRGLGRAVLDPGSGRPAGLTYPVRLGWSTIPSYAPGLDSLALPLLHGDRLTLPL